MNRARLTPRAEQDLCEVVAHIAGDNPDAAARVCAAVLDAADFLAANPGVGKAIRGARSKHREVRWYVLPRFRSYLL